MVVIKTTTAKLIKQMQIFNLMTVIEKKNEDGSITLCYEVFCPNCGLKNIFEVELMKAFSAVFCSYCRKKLDKFK